MELRIPEDSYVSVEEANKYHAFRNSFAEWRELDEQAKARRLVSASDFLDFSYRFLGKKVDPLQSRAFPRVNTGGLDQNGIPTSIKFAVFELALYEDLNTNQDQEMSSVRVGPVSASFEKSSTSNSPVNRFEYVKVLLDSYLDKRQSMGTSRMVRG